VLALGFISACALGPPGDRAPEVDAWPLVRYWSDPEHKERHAEVLWPFFEWHDGPGASAFYARPLFNRRKDKESRVTESDWVWPIGSGTRRPDLVRGVLYPLCVWDRERLIGGETRHRFILLPLVIYRAGPGPTDFLFFPFGGILHNFLAHKKIIMALWPIYVYQEKPPTRRWSVLHPVFSRIRYEGGGGGFKVWPLFGWATQPGRHNKLFILWPIFQREWLKTERGESHRLFIFPFYGQIDEPGGSARTVLWPFFGYRRDDSAGHTDWWYPWPFLGHRKGEEIEGRTLWPLYAWERRPNRYHSEFLWPLGWYWSQKGPDETQWSLRLVPLFFVEREDAVEGHTEGRARPADTRRSSGAWQIWPLVKWRREATGEDSFEFPSVWPYRYHAEFERNFGPFFRLFEYRRSADGSRSWRLLWRLLQVDAWPQGRYVEATPLFRYSVEWGKKRRISWSALKGLAGCSSVDGRGRRWQVLYFIRFGGGEKSDTETTP